MKKISLILSLVLFLSIFAFPFKVNAAPTTDIVFSCLPFKIGFPNSSKSLGIARVDFALSSIFRNAKVSVQGSFQNTGWGDWKTVSKGNPNSIGSEKTKLEAIRAKLEGVPEGYHLQYQAYVHGIGWQNWVQDNEIAGTTGQFKEMQALRFKIVKSPDSELKNENGPVEVSYDSHVQDIGWTEYVSNGESTGTVGQSKKIEGLHIKLLNAPSNMKIKYQAHVQNVGWQNWASNGQFAGTTGKNLRVEALKISLENAPGYHLEYQAHVQNIGWQNWVKDGQIAGTVGKGLRVEALRIKIVSNTAYKINVDNASYNTDTRNIDISGWTLSKAGIKKVETIIDNNTYTLDKLPRPDVYNSYPQYNDKNSGFTLSVPNTKITGGYVNTLIKVTENNGIVNKISNRIPVSGYIAPNDIDYNDDQALSSKLFRAILEDNDEVDDWSVLYYESHAWTVAQGHQQPNECRDEMQVKGVFLEYVTVPSDASYDETLEKAKVLKTEFIFNKKPYYQTIFAYKVATSSNPDETELRVVRVAIYNK
ncbi:MAG: hypothetical protein AB6733_03040 [Clostridiaceae bacterium]